MAKIKLGTQFTSQTAHDQYFIPFKNKLIDAARRGNHEAAYFLGLIAHHGYSKVLYQANLAEALTWYQYALAITGTPPDFKAGVSSEMSLAKEELEINSQEGRSGLMP